MLSGDWDAVVGIWEPWTKLGDLEAQFQLAYYYLFTWLDDDDPTKRQEMEGLLRDVANKDHPDAVYWLSHLGRYDDTEYQRLLLRAGNLGSRDAQRDLGASHATGSWNGRENSGPKDEAEAVRWYRLAAERGHADAQYNLGCMLLNGQGTQPDIAEGLRWLQLAAAGEDSSAPHFLAQIYGEGYYGISVDLEKAAYWKQQDEKVVAAIEARRRRWS